MRDFLEFVADLVGPMLVCVALCVLLAIPIACIDAQIPDATTIQHDGHRYVRFKNRDGVIHDPDCPCQHKTPEAE